MIHTVTSQTYTFVVPRKQRDPVHEERVSRANGRATVERLLAYGRKELAEYGAVDFNLDRVLRKSKVSRSSLYHHFQNRSGFVNALEVEVVYRDLMLELEVMRSFILGSSDVEEIFASIEFALSASSADTERRRRGHRVQSLAAANSNPELHRILATAQRDGTEHFAETLRLAVEKGTFRIDQPITGVAYLVQSILVGRVLVDLVDDAEIDHQWVAATMVALRRLLCTS